MRVLLPLVGMKSIVTIYMPSTATLAEFGLNAPFLVQASEPMRSGIYEEEPDVLLQMQFDQKIAKFEAEWVEGRWNIGRRLLDS